MAPGPADAQEPRHVRRHRPEVARADCNRSGDATCVAPSTYLECMVTR